MPSPSILRAELSELVQPRLASTPVVAVAQCRQRSCSHASGTPWDQSSTVSGSGQRGASQAVAQVVEHRLLDVQLEWLDVTHASVPLNLELGLHPGMSDLDRAPDRREGVASASMDIHEALYTTRAMRRVKPDPVPLDVQQRILDAAIRAPSGGNTQGWQFVFVDDPEVKGRIGPLYRDAISQLWQTIYADRIAAAMATPDSDESRSMLAVQRSAQWLADHFESVPLFLFCFVQHDPTGGSIYPAAWSAQLAARAEGVGSSPHERAGLLPSSGGRCDPRSARR